MTITELANELKTLIESGYGDAKAVVGIPTLYVTQDGDIWTNKYRDKTECIKFSAKDYIEHITGRKLSKIRLHNANYYECSWEDYLEDDCNAEDAKSEND